MNRRHLVGLIFAIAAICGLSLWWWQRDSPPNVLVNRTASPLATLPVDVEASGFYKPADVLPANEPKFFRATGYPPSTQDEKAMWDYWWNIRKVNPDWEWERPIAFYGKVVDQNDQPIDGAKIWMGWTAVGATPERTILSEVDGTFQIAGIKGKRLVVRVQKAGYHDGPTSAGDFEYAGFWESIFHIPDMNNPVIFRLRKRGDEEPMYLWSLAKDLKADGSVNWFNVKSGKFGGAAGDLAFIVTRSNQTRMRQFDYTLTVQAAPGGGIAFSEEKMMFEAPSEGYVPSWQTAQTFGAPDYTHLQKLRFYLKTPDGKYAAVQGHVAQMGDPEAQVQMTVYYNPNGSRNLEYNEAKRLNR
jgi:hypothetical protein